MSPWNYSDLLPPIFIIAVVSIHLRVNISVEYPSIPDYTPNGLLYTVHGMASLLMWMKLLYFLRIFENTSYLIRMITNVLWDMRVFLLILFLFYFAFGEAFNRINETSDPAS